MMACHDSNTPARHPPRAALGASQMWLTTRSIRIAPRSFRLRLHPLHLPHCQQLPLPNLHRLVRQRLRLPARRQRQLVVHLQLRQPRRARLPRRVPRGARPKAHQSPFLPSQHPPRCAESMTRRTRLARQLNIPLVTQRRDPPAKTSSSSRLTAQPYTRARARATKRSSTFAPPKFAPIRCLARLGKRPAANAFGTSTPMAKGQGSALPGPCNAFPGSSSLWRFNASRVSLLTARTRDVFTTRQAVRRLTRVPGTMTPTRGPLSRQRSRSNAFRVSWWCRSRNDLGRLFEMGHITFLYHSMRYSAISRTR